MKSDVQDSVCNYCSNCVILSSQPRQI